VHIRLRKHGVVLELRLPQWWCVASNDDQLRLARTQTLERRLVTEHDLTGLHHKRKARVDGVGRLLGLLWCHCVRLCNLGRVGWAVVDF